MNKSSAECSQGDLYFTYIKKLRFHDDDAENDDSSLGRIDWIALENDEIYSWPGVDETTNAYFTEAFPEKLPDLKDPAERRWPRSNITSLLEGRAPGETYLPKSAASLCDGHCYSGKEHKLVMPDGSDWHGGRDNCYSLSSFGNLNSCHDSNLPELACTDNGTACYGTQMCLQDWALYGDEYAWESRMDIDEVPRCWCRQEVNRIFEWEWSEWIPQLRAFGKRYVRCLSHLIPQDYNSSTKLSTVQSPCSHHHRQHLHHIIVALSPNKCVKIWPTIRFVCTCC